MLSGRPIRRSELPLLPVMKILLNCGSEKAGKLEGELKGRSVVSLFKGENRLQSEHRLAAPPRSALARRARAPRNSQRGRPPPSDCSSPNGSFRSFERIFHPSLAPTLPISLLGRVHDLRLYKADRSYFVIRDGN